jgi:hypothetical protein
MSSSGGSDREAITAAFDRLDAAVDQIATTPRTTSSSTTTTTTRKAATLRACSQLD